MKFVDPYEKNKYDFNDEVRYDQHEQSDLGIVAQPRQENIDKRISSDGKQYMRGKKLALRVFLFVLAIVSFFIMSATIIGIAMSQKPISGIEVVYKFCKYAWIYWVAIPLPVASLVFGTVYLKNFKVLSNIIVGFVMMSIMLFSGFAIVGTVAFDKSSEYWQKIGNKLEMYFPDDMEAITIDFANSKTPEEGDYVILKISIAEYDELFSNVIESRFFLSSCIESEVPASFYQQTEFFNGFIVKEIEAYPIQGEYYTTYRSHFVAIAVFKPYRKMLLYEYYKK